MTNYKKKIGTSFSIEGEPLSPSSPPPPKSKKNSEINLRLPEVTPLHFCVSCGSTTSSQQLP